jgi:type II secretory pathway pseudopilin PulG
MSKRATSGFTLIELLLATVGLSIIMLSVYTIFSGGVKNWTTIEPQLTMRQETTDALYGKAGDKSGGITASLQSARLLLDGIVVGTTTETVYAWKLNHGTISSSVIYFIKDDKQQVGTNTPPGTFSPTGDEVICYYAKADYLAAGTYSSWSLRKDVYDSESMTILSSKVVLKEIGNTKRLCPICNGTGTCSACNETGKAYNIFTYYDKARQAITPANIVARIAARDVAYIKIDIQRDIDFDKDHKWGEDPIDRKNNDGDTRIDEDKPMDLSLQNKVFPRMLWKDKPQ